MHNRMFTCTSTWTKYREGGSGIQNPLSKTWDNTKNVYCSLVTQEKVLLMKIETYFANKMALKSTKYNMNLAYSVLKPIIKS